MKAFSHPPGGCDIEIRRVHGMHLVGRTDEVREHFYAITVERRITHPAVAAIAKAARDGILS
jgi:LysR family transcriptional activator of nhaA